MAQLMTKDTWRDYAEANRESQCLDGKVEVELWHNGHLTLIWSKLRKIARFTTDDGEATCECWETMTERDSPTKFTVLLPKGQSLPSHMEHCKFMETDFGARLCNRVINIALIGLNLLLIMALLGVGVETPDISQWYFTGAFGFVGGLFLAVMIYNKVSTCRRVVLECGIPEQEIGDNHVCLICHSKAGSVIQQMGAIERHQSLFADAIDGMITQLNKKRVWIEDQNLRLQYELEEIEGEEVEEVESRINSRLRMNSGVRVVEKIPILWVIGFLAAGLLVGAGLLWYFLGA